MTNRRQFMKEAAATAGVLFTGCSLLHRPLQAQPAPAPKRRQVTVGGRRVRTIDIHAHVVVPEATALMGRKTAPGNAAVMEGAMRPSASHAWTTGAPICRPSVSTPPGMRSSAT